MVLLLPGALGTAVNFCGVRPVGPELQVLLDVEMLGKSGSIYPCVRRERFGARGIQIPYIFPIQWGANELLRLSQL